MVTSLAISPDLMRTVERRAAERGVTPDALIEELVRRGLADGPPAVPLGTASDLPPLPTFRMGTPLMDPNDRDAMDEVLNGERDRRLYGRRRPDEPA